MTWHDVERRRPRERTGQAVARRSGSLNERQLSRLTSALWEEAAQADGGIRVIVTNQTATVEVRISGKNARRRLVFQGVQVHVTHIRQVVSKALERYGPSLAYVLGRANPELEVLYMSGHREAASPAPGQAVPEPWFLTKPFDRDAFVHRILALIAQQADEGSGL